MATLLERALEVKVARKRKALVSTEEIELAIAWLREEVNMQQIAAVYKGKSMQYKIALFIKEGYNRGLIQVVK